MGIKHLNKFLKENANDSIKFVNMPELSGKKIAVDISIYMYRYASDNNLIENMYLMLSIFRYYNIIPIFIFDGKPPVEKKELLIKRKESKNLIYSPTQVELRTIMYQLYSIIKYSKIIMMYVLQ